MRVVLQTFARRPARMMALKAMIDMIRWTDRTFDHRWPVRLLPVIVERLRGTPIRAAALLGEADDARRREQRGGWSAQEHIGHLDDLHELDLLRLNEFLSGARVLSAADMTNRATYEARHNATPTAELLDRLRTRREDFVRRLEPLTEEEADRAADHPRLHRPLRLVDWLYFVAEHDDHHLAQAGRILRAVRRDHHRFS